MTIKNAKKSHRLLAAFMSLLMVLSVIPFSATTALAATAEHPDAVTITVVDGDGKPVNGATVAYTIDSVAQGAGYISNNKITDEYGVVEVLPASDFVADDLTIKATITAGGYDAGEITEQAIASADQNFEVVLVSTAITDVKIEGKPSTYNGEEQELVSIQGLQEGDTVDYGTLPEGVKLNDEGKPVATNAGTYKINVTVKRDGKDDLNTEVTTTIEPAEITDIDITPVTGLKYNKASQALVTLTGSFAEDDVVTWTVNGIDTGSQEIPKRDAVGNYTVKLTVERTNYKILEKEVSVTIALGEIALGELKISGNDLTYNGSAQQAISITNYNADEYKLKYQISNKNDKTITDANDLDNTKWLDLNPEGSMPMVTDAGQYIVWVKAIKTDYEDQGIDVGKAENATLPFNIYVAKAEQSLQFVNQVSNEVTVDETTPENNVYDFSVTGENLSGQDVKYSLVDVSDDGVASISANGQLTVAKAGIVTVKATREGNDNYNAVDIYATVTVKVSGNGLISFAKDTVDYVLDESGIASMETATKANDDDNGSLSYSIDNKNVGLSIDSKTGQVTISNRNKLAKAMGHSGNITVTVTVEKTTGTVTANKWVKDGWLWLYKPVTEEVYPSSSASYTLLITYAAAPEFDTVCRITDPAATGWYNAESPAVVSSIDTAKYSIALDSPESFSDSQTISTQGTEAHYIYVKDKTTKQISAGIEINIKIDTVAPDANNMTIDIKDLNIIEKIGYKFGFFNPKVEIRFTVADETKVDESGMQKFTWYYTKDSNAAASIEADKSGELIPDIEDGKYTATLTITASELETYRGKISFTATDKAGNESAKKYDKDNVIVVVDKINPVMSADFKLTDSNGKYNPVNTNDTVQHYYDGSVDFTFTVTEQNFFPEDVIVKVENVSKDPVETQIVTPIWTDGDNDNHYGKFTLSGDGDYVVTMSYQDQSKNVMLDGDGTKVELYTSEVITIDTINPVVKIETDILDENGFGKETQKTVFSVTEHNFRASDIFITGTMKDINGNDIEFTAESLTNILRKADWTQKKDEYGNLTDTYTYTFEYDGYKDGIYNLKMDYKDISGWNATQFVAKEFIIDHGAPTDIKIEYAKSPMDTFFEVITLGFYNPSVTVRFTAYDTSAGVDSFTWGYTKETGASVINHPESLADTTITANQDQTDKSKFTAEITITADKLKQYRGYLSVLATDTFQNKSDKKVDDGNIIVVDTIAPTMTVEYSEASNTVGTKAYYKGDINVKFNITEANFYAEDVKVTVTKNGGTPYSVDDQITWSDRDENDLTVGIMTLPAPADHSGDGHYIIHVDYADKSYNPEAESNNKITTYTSNELTIDTTLPVINVEYQNTNLIDTIKDSDGNDRKYFDNTQTAKITIDEHNFEANDVDFTIIAKDVTGKELDVSALNTKSEWSVGENEDSHIITITYPGDANYIFDVAYTDLATNEAADYATDYFTVDKTDPTNLTVDYSTSVLDTVLESVTFGFYNAKMIVTLTAEDPTSGVYSFLYSYLNANGVSSVNAELIKQVIAEADIKYSDDRKTATTTFEIPKMVLGNDNQFNGTVEFTATDRAGNETDTHKETKRIVVDNIAPNAQVSYNEATNIVGDISYFNGNINATITINEANFYANDVQVMVSKDGGAATAVTPTWRNDSVDVHVGTFTLAEDGDYIVTVNYTDKSSNKMTTYTSKQMTIDTKIEAPTYTINGAAKSGVGGAYKGDATIGFSFNDQNFDTKTIKLTRTRFDKVEDVTDTFVKAINNDKGGSGTFTIPSEVGNDGIYLLTIGITDKAKHTTESEIKFTINRFGSVYEYSDELVNLIKDGGQYITSVDKDLIITEYNADRILEGSLKILITRDGETVDVDFTSNPAKIDAQVGIGESGWYQYVYTIKAANFEKDGVYKISLSSAYSADDSERNESTSVPENSIDKAGKEILDTMSFTVDSVAPEIRNIVNLDKKIAEIEKISEDGKLNVKYTIVDVGGLKTIEIIVNGKTIQTLTAEEIADNLYNFTGSFDLEEQDGTTAHKIQIRVTDLAGNVTDTNSEEFLKAHSNDNENSTYVFFNEVTVSRNFLVRWYANKPLFWGSIGGVIVLAGAIWFLVAFKRKKKEDKEEK